jgi:hypothetical protein
MADAAEGVAAEEHGAFGTLVLQLSGYCPAAGQGSKVQQGAAYLGQQPLGDIRFAMIGVFVPIERRHMRRIFTEIGSPDAKLRTQVDPVPQFVAGYPSLPISVAANADNISREPVAIPAPKLPP